MTKRPTDIVNELTKQNYFDKPSLVVDAIYEAFFEGEKSAYDKIQKVAENSTVASNEMIKEVTGVRDLAVEKNAEYEQLKEQRALDEQKRMDEEDNL